MRTFKSVALLTTLALAGIALAVDSTSTGYSTAERTVTATGTYASAVSFTLLNTTLTIPTKQVRPGAAFTVTVPVTNTTDRAITITAGEVEAPSNVTVTATTSTFSLDVGASGNLVYSVEFDADGAGAEALGGTAVEMTFQVLANDTAATEDDLTVSSD